MATHQQYEYFKFKYKEEDERNSLLMKRAEIYLSIVSLIFTGIIFKITEIKSYCAESWVSLVIFAGLIGVLICAVWFILQAIRLLDYQQDMDVAEYVEELGEDPISDNEFFDNRIAKFISATAFNFKVNNSKAADLSSARRFILLSFLFLLGFLIAIIT